MNKVLIIAIAIAGCLTAIDVSYCVETPKNDNQVIESSETIKEEEPTIQTTTTTTTTTKKVVKTTKKNTQSRKIYSNSKVETGSKAEYMAYAKEQGGYNDTQMQCLDYLWSHESGWNPNSVNKSSGSCGIPQAYPCKKIAQQQGSNDWKSQIRWGINYIQGRYKNPCGAWNHFKNKHWY